MAASNRTMQAIKQHPVNDELSCQIASQVAHNNKNVRTQKYRKKKTSSRQSKTIPTTPLWAKRQTGQLEVNR
jgi:hypothetical protein